MSHDVGFGLAGKGVVITGAAGAIGRELARSFASAGAKVALVDLDSAALQKVAATLDGEGHMTLALDLRDVPAFPDRLREVQTQLGGLDVLINCAGVLIRCADLDDVTEADWDAQQDVNLKATFFLSRAAVGLMRGQGRGGRVISFVSQAWWTGSYSTAVVYAASKGGVVSMMRGFARSYSKDRITFNAIAPGAVDSEMMRSGLSEAQVQAMAAQIPLGYMSPPSDLTGAALFLASDHASYMTGTVLNVSGGWLMY